MTDFNSLNICIVLDITGSMGAVIHRLPKMLEKWDTTWIKNLAKMDINFKSINANIFAFRDFLVGDQGEEQNEHALITIPSVKKGIKKEKVAFIPLNELSPLIEKLSPNGGGGNPCEPMAEIITDIIENQYPKWREDYLGKISTDYFLMIALTDEPMCNLSSEERETDTKRASMKKFQQLLMKFFAGKNTSLVGILTGGLMKMANESPEAFEWNEVFSIFPLKEDTNIYTVPTIPFHFIKNWEIIDWNTWKIIFETNILNIVKEVDTRTPTSTPKAFIDDLFDEVKRIIKNEVSRRIDKVYYDITSIIEQNIDNLKPQLIEAMTKDLKKE